MSKNFKLTLVVRTIGYCTFIFGVLAILVVFGPIAQAETSYRIDQALGVRKVVANVDAQNSKPDATSSASQTSFGDIESNEEVITPTSTKFGLVIPKINANADIIPDVDPTNEKAYTKALAKGVAHAAGTNYPGQVGNTYLFSHSTDAPWNVVRYNAVFYLLRELEAGDEIIVFYNNIRYDYIVYDKQIISPTDTTFLTNKYAVPTLTLQTCDPPGTLLHRLIVRAKLAGS